MRRLYSAITDSRGCFTIENIEPGIWSAWCTLLASDKVALLKNKKNILNYPEILRVSTFHGIEIPQSPGSDFILNLVFPGSVIRGILCNKKTGLPIEDPNMLFHWVMINVPDQALRINGLSLARSGNRFELTGIKAGRYQLGVAAFGYDQYFSGIFSIDEGQIKDMGSILLEPVGTMEIEVFDRAGNPLRFWADWKGKSGGISIYGLDSIPIFPGREIFGNLPFGPLLVEITAPDFLSQKITVEIDPSNRAKVKVVLDPAR